MKNKTKWLLASVPAALIGLLITSNGPLGKLIWPMPSDSVAPAPAQLPFLLGLDVLQSAAFGLGVAFILFGYRYVSGFFGPSAGPIKTGLTHASVAWLLVNWVPHIALHQALGDLDAASKLWTLIAIDYGFHATAIAATFIVVASVLRKPTGEMLAVPRAAAAGAQGLGKSKPGRRSNSDG